MARQRDAAADARAALLELLDALYRLTADMARDDSTAEAADAVRFAAAVSSGLTPEQVAQWLRIRGAAVPALDSTLTLFRALQSAAVELDDMAATASAHERTSEAADMVALSGLCFPASAV